MNLIFFKLEVIFLNLKLTFAKLAKIKLCDNKITYISKKKKEKFLI